MAMLGKSMHAHHDRLTLAAADSPQSVAPAACIDATHDLEISPCTTQLRLLVAAGFTLTLFSATLAFDWWDGLGDYDTTVGYAGVVLFGLVTGRLIWLLPAERGPVVIVTPYGIRDLRIGNEFLLWDSIAEISAEESRGHKAIVLTLTPALQRQLCTMSTLAPRAENERQNERQNERIVIRSEGLATDFDTLLRACRDCHAASAVRTALQQEYERGTQGFAVQAS
jgi:hypothetical protein